jgi:hypothetical protein
MRKSIKNYIIFGATIATPPPAKFSADWQQQKNLAGGLTALYFAPFSGQRLAAFASSPQYLPKQSSRMNKESGPGLINDAFELFCGRC